MGQKPSHLGGRTNKSKLPISWILRSHQTTHTPNPEQPIKFQYKTRRKNVEQQGKHNSEQTNNTTRSFGRITTLNNLNNISTNRCNISNNNNNNLKNNKVNDLKCQIVKTQNVPIRTKSEPTLFPEKTREKHRHRRKSTRDVTKYERNEKIVQQFGYEIEDVDAFLTKVRNKLYYLQ